MMFFKKTTPRYRVVRKTYGDGRKVYEVQEYSTTYNSYQPRTQWKTDGIDAYLYTDYVRFDTKEEAFKELQRLEKIDAKYTVVSEEEVKCEDCSNQ